MKKIALTGFGKFGGHATNPTQLLVQQQNWKLKNAQIYTKVWDVDFETVQQQYPIWLELVQPDVIVNLGLKAAATSLELEKYAHNIALNSDFSPIVDNDKYRYETNLDLDILMDKLSEKSILAQISHDAGPYLCNFIYFYSLRYAQQFQKKALFIHLPFTTEMMLLAAQRGEVIYPSLPEKMIHRGIKTILKNELLAR